MLPPLRPYQARGVADLRSAARELARRRKGYGLLAVAPTGAGKTRIALEVATSAIGKGQRVLWLAPRNELVEQPVRRLRATGWDDVCAIYDGRVEGQPTAPITVASIQTLVARDLTPPASVVVFDEARHYVADEWGRIAGAYSDVCRIGLDATPARADGKAMGELFDRIVPISSIAELTELGFLVPSRVVCPDEYGQLCDDPVPFWQRWAPGTRTLVFCPSQKEARKQAELFREAGVAAESVDASSTVDERRAALDRVRSGETTVLVNCMLYTEGLDLVELETIQIARGVGHPSTWIQIGGRGLRPSPHTGKTHCTILDMRGHFWRPQFGPLDAPRVYCLEGKPMTLQKGLPQCTMCPDCHGWYPGGTMCPLCGVETPAPPPPKVSKREAREQFYARQRRNGPKWETFRKYVADAMAKGHSKRAPAMRFKARYGHFPRFRFQDAEREILEERKAG